jgi:CBS domain-containing protein
MMITVRSMLQQKGDEIFALNPDSTIREALKLMAEKQIGAVMILEGEDKKVAGIFSERDYARLNANQRVNYNTQLKGVMTTKLYYVSPNETANVVMALMTDRHIRHLPVIQDNKLVGVISIGDVVKSVIHDQETTIENLEKYIMGGGYNR